MQPSRPIPPANPPLGLLAILVRLAVIGLVLLCLATGFAYAGGWLSPDRLTQTRFIAQFEWVFGVHSGFRRNHAKGVCVTGWFETTGQAGRISRAAVFNPGRVPVVGRFALSGGNPFVADAPNEVRSMALQFRMPNGEEWRTGINDIPVFPANTPQAFYGLLGATKPDPATGQPDPAKVGPFLAANPEVAAALGLLGKAPKTSGFADSTYNSLNAFRFIDASGRSTPVRWAMVPLQPVVAQTPSQATQTDKNYLFDEVITRIEQHPLQWRLVITVARPGDPVDDPALPWPDDREHVEAGTLTLDHVSEEAAGNCRDINYDPLVLPSGIEPSDDPLLSARSSAYSRSFTLRAGEPKTPSAVTVPPQQAPQKPGDHS